MDFHAYITCLTGKDAKAAYALAQQITEESRASDAWYSHFDDFDALLDEFLSHVTDVKPITARQCVAALPEIAEAKPELVPRIRTALEQTGLSGYPDSMQPLILKDIVAVLKKISTLGNQGA